MRILGSAKPGEPLRKNGIHRWIGVLLGLGLVLVTLTPSPSTGTPAPFFCITCGERWLADGILNLALFFPFGLWAGWNERSAARATLFGLLLSAVIELAQTVIPGRDPALSDILFNTLGTALGAMLAIRHRVWLRPNARESLILTSLSILAVGLLMTATAVLLAPAGKSGVVQRFGDDMLFQYQSRAGSLSLDQPEYWLSNQLRGVRSLDDVMVRRERDRWRITIVGARPVTLGPTVGQGWSMLAYPDAIGRRWTRLLNALWMLVLCVTVGYWARGRLWLVAALALAAIIAIIPVAGGIKSTTMNEWSGAAMGFVMGAALRLLSRRRQGVPENKRA
jgi:hypothetical protein